jgi:hypothetical protein
VSILAELPGLGHGRGDFEQVVEQRARRGYGRLSAAALLLNPPKRYAA